MARSPHLTLVIILLGATAAAADTCSDLATNPSLARQGKGQKDRLWAAAHNLSLRSFRQ